MQIALLLVVGIIALFAVLHFSKPVKVLKEVPSDHFKETADPTEPILEYKPNMPSPVDLYNTQPYHLLSDVMDQPRLTESISCVNSRSCYATDFQSSIQKTGNYSQMTNNYKRKYPDSCSAPVQELVLNFYKTGQ
jgi:hypothetical protein